MTFKEVREGKEFGVIKGPNLWEAVIRYVCLESVYRGPGMGEAGVGGNRRWAVNW